MNFIIQIIISTLAIIATSYVLPGVHMEDFLTAVILAIVLAFLNAVVKPLMIILTLPITIITLGLFLIVINALLILLADKIIGPDFEVDGFITALLFSLVLWFITAVLEGLKGNKKDK